LLHFLDSEDPAWAANNHPELAHGAAAWVKQLRKQSDRRPAPSKPRRAKRK
jgi:hypothetical protein